MAEPYAEPLMVLGTLSCRASTSGCPFPDGPELVGEPGVVAHPLVGQPCQPFDGGWVIGPSDCGVERGLA